MKELICPACGRNFQVSGTASRRRKYCYDKGCAKARKSAHDHQNYLKNVRPKELDGLTPEEIEVQRRGKISRGNTGKVRTQEARDKNSAHTKALWESGVFAPRPHTPEAKEKIRQATLRQFEEGRVNLEGLAKGRSRTYEERVDVWTDEKRAVQAERTLQAYQEGRMKAYGRHRGRWAIYDGPKGTIKMRSRSETIFAYDLDAQGIDWFYEPRRFDLGWSTYCPDFYLPAFDRWIEIKGHQTDLAERKVTEFAQTHRMTIVLAQDLQRLEKVNV